MRRIFAILYPVAALAFAAAPFWAGEFGGFRPGQFPVPQENPPAQPAGWAFAIWGLIYLWLVAGSLFGLLRRGDSADWAPLRVWAFASLVPGAAWLSVAQVSPVWATVLIWWMAATAVGALLAAGESDRWFQRGPVGLYAGWLTAAASVSLALVAAGHGWMSEVPAALVALLVALTLAFWVQTRRPDTPEYGLAVIWALAGVLVANLSGGNVWVMGLAALGIALMGLRLLLPSRD